MTGPEHYARAEQIVDQTEDSAQHYEPEWYAARMAQAQVHATLALVAATVDQIASRGPGDVANDWTEAVWQS